MSLPPKLKTLTYEMTFPSDGTKVSFRPYQVREEKILLTAAESKDVKEIAKATRMVVNSCILEKDFDCAKRPVFDLDYAFMNIRARSIGEKVNNEYTCQNIPEGQDEVCGTPFSIEFDIADIEYVDPKEESVVKIDDEFSAKMKYTPYQAVLNIGEKDNDYEKTIKTLMESIDSLFDKESVFTFSDVSPADKRSFLEGLRIEPFNKMKRFVENMPYFKLELGHKCTKCGFEHKMIYNDPTRFF